MIEEYTIQESTRMSRPIVAIFKGERPVGSITFFEDSDFSFVEDIKIMIGRWNEILKAEQNEK